MTGTRDTHGWDLVVVGAGVLGVMAAAVAAQRRPEARILLLDRHTPLSGASGSSAALIVHHAAGDDHRELVRQARRHFAASPLKRYLTPVPMLFAVRAEQAETVSRQFLPSPLPEASPRLRAALEGGCPDLRIEPGEVLLDGSAVCSVMDVRAWTADVLAGAMAGSPAPQVWHGATVTAVRRQEPHWLVETAGGVAVTAPAVLLATGAWPAVEVQSGVRRGPGKAPYRVTGKLVAALHLRPESLSAGAGGGGGITPGVVFLDDDLFILPGPHPLVSFRSDLWSPGTSSAVPVPGLPVEEMAHGRKLLASRSARLADEVIGGRACYDAYAPRRLPSVGAASAVPGLAWMTGGSGSGVRFAPALAHRAVDAVWGTP